MPEEVGGNTGLPIASDSNTGERIQFATCANFDGDPENELVIVRERLDGFYKLHIYDMPTTVGGETGPPIASDHNIGKSIVAVSAANFDSDPEDELVIVRERLDGFHKLHIYDMPTTVGGNTGSPIASDHNIGRSIILRGVAAGNFDGDPENEIAVVRIRSDDFHKLHIYDVPTAVGGNTGPPIASDNNIGKSVRAIAACEFASVP
jgi:hypothetical protein